jgi:hypothetical protein
VIAIGSAQLATTPHTCSQVIAMGSAQLATLSLDYLAHALELLQVCI